MALTRQDSVELIREIERLLREYDPGSLELVLHATEQSEDPRRNLVSFLATIRRIYAERSSGEQSAILDQINHFVRQEDGQLIRGISVELSPLERELSGREEFNLAELPDRSAFIAELDRITAEIKREVEPPEDQQ